MRFAKQMARYSGGLLFTLLVGGDGLNQQFEALSAGPDAIIATPGRLMHLLSEVPGFGLSQCAYVVFDEADAPERGRVDSEVCGAPPAARPPRALSAH